MLQPVAIHARTADESDFTLQITDGPEINPVLVYALHRSFGVDMHVDGFREKIDNLIAEITDPAEQVRQSVQEVVEPIQRSGLEVGVEDRILVGVFSYDKLPMVRDLQTARDLMARHTIVAAVAGDPDAAQELLASGVGDPAVPSDAVAPGNEYLVLDADSSQHAALSRAMAGCHVMIDGPPGTGKSQTIANLIAGLAAQGKRILFVAEKRMAIEAVTDRLAGIDLGHLVFDLHDRRIDRRRIAQQIAESLDRAANEPAQDFIELHRRLSQHRGKVIEHARVLHEIHDPWGLSYFGALCDLLRLPVGFATAVRFRGAQLRDLNFSTAAAIEQDLSLNPPRRFV